ncbi:hypothetical protein JL722_11334 [Aureococcus anophagefferens]|nr:hypothetical protein JL722_11334 [Aureococcus anophagefferens]
MGQSASSDTSTPPPPAATKPAPRACAKPADPARIAALLIEFLPAPRDDDDDDDGAETEDYASDDDDSLDDIVERVDDRSAKRQKRPATRSRGPRGRKPATCRRRRFVTWLEQLPTVTHSIVAMPPYGDKSVEELRHEDYLIQRRADLARRARTDPTDPTVATRLGAVELELTKATQAMTARMPPPWAPLPEDRAYGLGAGDRVDGVLAPLVRFLDVGLSLREDVPGAWPAHTFAAAALALVERAYACEAAKDVIQEEDVIWDVARLLGDDGVPDDACPARASARAYARDALRLHAEAGRGFAMHATLALRQAGAVAVDAAASAASLGLIDAYDDAYGGGGDWAARAARDGAHRGPPGGGRRPDGAPALRRVRGARARRVPRGHADGRRRRGRRVPRVFRRESREDAARTWARAKGWRFLVRAVRRVRRATEAKRWGDAVAPEDDDRLKLFAILSVVAACAAARPPEADADDGDDGARDACARERATTCRRAAVSRALFAKEFERARDECACSGPRPNPNHILRTVARTRGPIDALRDVERKGGFVAARILQRKLTGHNPTVDKEELREREAQAESAEAELLALLDDEEGARARTAAAKKKKKKKKKGAAADQAEVGGVEGKDTTGGARDESTGAEPPPRREAAREPRPPPQGAGASDDDDDDDDLLLLARQPTGRPVPKPAPKPAAPQKPAQKPKPKPTPAAPKAAPKPKPTPAAPAGDAELTLLLSREEYLASEEYAASTPPPPRPAAPAPPPPPPRRRAGAAARRETTRRRGPRAAPPPPPTTVSGVLARVGLGHLEAVFEAEEVDFEALGLLRPDDFASLGIAPADANAIVSALAAPVEARFAPARRGRLSGTVLWFNKSHGFVQPDGGGADVFVHLSDVCGVLKAGDRVLYDVTRFKGRDKCVDVVKAGAGAAPAPAPAAAPPPPPLRCDSLPDEFTCPISFELMEDPVIAADGHTYERRAIAAWFERRRTSPITNEALPNLGLVPAHAIRSMIARYRATAS